jgi:hypothetical protein
MRASINRVEWGFSGVRPFARLLGCVRLALALLAVGLFPLQAEVESVPPAAPEYSVKAAFLTLFAQHTTWPANAFENDSSPIIIGVWGKDPFGDTLKKTARQQIARRPFIVREIATEAEAAQCHVIFISKDESSHETRWLNALKDKPILTVGETEESLARGAVVEFVLPSQKEKHLRFETSLPAMTNAGLKIDSQMLGSARRVYQSRPLTRS